MFRVKCALLLIDFPAAARSAILKGPWFRSMLRELKSSNADKESDTSNQVNMLQQVLGSFSSIQSFTREVFSCGSGVHGEAPFLRVLKGALS